MLDHEKRRLLLGCSELGAAMNADQWRGPWDVCFAKKHPEVPRPQATWPQRLGKTVEPLLVECGAEITGHQFRYYDQSVVNPDLPYLICTPDGLDEKARIGIEAKVLHWSQGKCGSTAEDLPWPWRLQCIGGMAVLNYELWYVVVWQDGEPRVIPVWRDREIEKPVLKFAENFCRRFIAGDEMPPVGSSDATTYWIRQAFPRNKEDLREADSSEVGLLQEYETLRLHELNLIEYRAELEHRICLAIRDHEGLKWPGGKFTWKLTKDSKRMDWESMALALMTNYVKDPDARATLLKDYERVHAGYRRIHFASGAFKEAKQREVAA